MEACRKRRAKLVISGVGKSGIVARKIAATFSSFGLTAVFLNPVDALHGDLALSIRKTLPCCSPTAAKPTSCWGVPSPPQGRGTARMALVGRVNSSLASGCNVVLNGSVDREVCPPTWPSPQARP